jgi:hypothetical protein
MAAVTMHATAVVAATMAAAVTAAMAGVGSGAEQSCTECGGSGNNEH